MHRKRNRLRFVVSENRCFDWSRTCRAQMIPLRMIQLVIVGKLQIFHCLLLAEPKVSSKIQVSWQLEHSLMEGIDHSWAREVG